MSTTERNRWRAEIDALVARTRARFEALEPFADVAPALALHRPLEGAWNTREVLEHVALANRFLLVLARKTADKSARRVATGAEFPAHGARFEHLATLASRGLAWSHPAHMTPTGAVEPAASMRQLLRDRDACLELLAAQPAGEGTLHRIRMSVVEGDDRLDLYQFIECIGLHAERHLAQLERNAASFAQNP